MADDAMDKAFARVRQSALATGLPEISAGTSYGTPSLRVKDKSFVRLNEALYPSTRFHQRTTRAPDTDNAGTRCRSNARAAGDTRR